MLPLKDPTSDMAVIARKGSTLVKQVRGWGLGLGRRWGVSLCRSQLSTRRRRGAPLLRAALRVCFGRRGRRQPYPRPGPYVANTPPPISPSACAPHHTCTALHRPPHL